MKKAPKKIEAFLGFSKLEIILNLLNNYIS